MLPGFRFLFAAIMLSMSLLVFGLGAAALLRAAHESFASNSAWRATPEVPFAQHPDTTVPMLATLRVEPNAMEKANDPVKVNPAPTDQPPSSAETAGSEQIAALRPAETPPAETAKPAELPAATVVAAPVETAPVGAASPTANSAADEQKMTAVAALDTAPAKSEPVAVQTEPTILPPANPTTGTATTGISATSTPATTAAPAADPEAGIATTKIATLGGPPVDITDAGTPESRAAKSDRAKPDESVVRKRAQARRSIRRRRLAARARLLAQQQLQANPFGQQQQTFPPTAPAAPR